MKHVRLYLFPSLFLSCWLFWAFPSIFAFSVMVAHLFSSTFPSMFLICGLKVAVWIIMFVLLNGRLSLILWFSQSLSFINTLLVTLSPPSAHTHTLTHFHFSVPLLDLCWPLKLMKNTEKQPLHNIKSAQTSAVTVEPPHLFDVLCLEQLMLMANLKCFAPPLLLYHPCPSSLWKLHWLLKCTLLTDILMWHVPRWQFSPDRLAWCVFSSCHYQGNPPRLRNSYDKWTVRGQSALNFTAQWRAPYSPTRMNQTRFELKESKEGGMRSEKLKMRSQCSLQADRIKWKRERFRHYIILEAMRL